MKRRIFCLIIAVLLCVGAFSGCGETEKQTFKLDTYPIEGNPTLTCWMPLYANLAQLVSNFGETEYAKELEKRTGVKVEYVHPAVGTNQETFNLMVASGEMTDIVQYDFLNYNGGPNTLLEQKVILQLNDLIEEYAPNLKSILDSNEEYKTEVTTFDGKMYVFPMIMSDPMLKTTSGPIMRQDWLDELGLETPETVDEWEHVLTEFKNKKGARSPFSFVYSSIRTVMQMLESNYDFYIQNGEVKYGPMEPNFKRALETLNSWYEKGLLDKNIISVDSKGLDAKVLNGETGAFIASGGSGMGKYIASAMDDKFNLMATTHPTFNKGEKNKYNTEPASYGSSGSVAISAQCKNPELAAKFLDYSYSEEGSMLANFGIEGVSYEMVDGKAKYTELITNNPEGKSMSEIMPLYFRSCVDGPFVQSGEYIKQYYTLPQQKEALVRWCDRDTSGEISTYKSSYTLTAEESREYATIMTNVDKTLKESIVKFITGVESFDNYDKFIETLKKYKVERAIEIKQEAYDRYKK